LDSVLLLWISGNFNGGLALDGERRACQMEIREERRWTGRGVPAKWRLERRGASPECKLEKKETVV